MFSSFRNWVDQRNEFSMNKVKWNETKWIEKKWKQMSNLFDLNLFISVARWSVWGTEREKWMHFSFWWPKINDFCFGCPTAKLFINRRHSQRYFSRFWSSVWGRRNVSKIIRSLDWSCKLQCRLSPRPFRRFFSTFFWISSTEKKKATPKMI